MCLFVQARVYLSEPKSLAYYEILHFPVNYESVKFYSAGPRSLTATTRVGSGLAYSVERLSRDKHYSLFGSFKVTKLKVFIRPAPLQWFQSLISETEKMSMNPDKLYRFRC